MWGWRYFTVTIPTFNSHTDINLYSCQNISLRLLLFSPKTADFNYWSSWTESAESNSVNSCQPTQAGAAALAAPSCPSLADALMIVWMSLIKIQQSVPCAFHFQKHENKHGEDQCCFQPPECPLLEAQSLSHDIMSPQSLKNTSVLNRVHLERNYVE